ncbi:MULTISPECIES: DEAD/DEAH box helicase [unclassified Leptolyngbya]|uniref:DEAD/DEAH box helicase n=1 Tax=unclassified Leptolyngbya TaxID=2650499 RepID=UPI0016858E6E|nr:MULTISPECIES: DEAD/DEAH box helicase [unclassified Leptolyngbya]MBD1909835.1 DEAD/DEAH box helicase [Leptolyngbya sp. FACHB-8]MBD2158986.1 DEAD/DEAH box helicase [Leptolyngbya sp. FACHB-16]
MQILHGTWIPQVGENRAKDASTTEDFVQKGSFYLWVETTERQTLSAKSQRHPRQLVSEDLAGVLHDDFGVQSGGDRPNLVNLIEPKYFLLPTVNNEPLPSLELSRYLEEELPENFEWQYWQIDCCPTVIRTKNGELTNSVVAVLNDLHFLAMHNLADVQLGSDLLFWFHYTQALKRIIYKDQYIPALRYRELPPVPLKETKSRAKKTATAAKATSKKTASTQARKPRGSTATSTRRRSAELARKTAVTQTIDVTATTDSSNFEIYPAWEFVGEEYETTVQQYVDYMPLICVAGFSKPQETPLFYDRETLLRHFSECLLTDIATHIPTTQAYEKTIADSLLYACLHPSGRPWKSVDKLEQYKQWLAWRDRIVRTQTEQPFYLCFQLQDPLQPEDPWALQLQVAPKSDPSLRVALLDYWRMKPKQQQQVKKQLGKDFEQHLLTNLGYAARMYPELWKGLDTDQPVGIYLDLNAAFAFLKESAWVLENAGYKVIVPSWWTPQGRRRAKVRLRAKGKSVSGGKTKNSAYFSLETLVEYQYELAIGDEPLTDQEWKQLVNAKTPLIKFRGQWMELDQDKMQQMLTFWKAQQQENPELSLLDFLKLTAGNEEELEIQVDRQDVLSDMLSKLNDKGQLQPVDDPAQLQGNLREYQKRGVSWLQYLEEIGLNGCLADDMGLGKTIQVIARILQERELAGKNRIKIPPTLLIAPTSVVGNWHREIQKFAPVLRATVHHGSQRTKESQEFKKTCRENDVVITSFTLARKDIKLFSDIQWHRVVLDEAQNIKNPKADLTKSVLKLSAPHRLALTGTPIENRLMDLWSIFNFLNPGYLGNQTQFRRNFELPIQKNNKPQQAETLKKLVEPFILRRVKTDQSIIKDLPDKVEQKLYCNLTKEQASLYEAVVKDVEERIQTTEGIERKGLILSTLTKLKQICNHPMQFLQDGSDFTPERSHKLSRLDEMVQEAIDEGESLLIFTQFTEIGEAVEKYLRQTRHYNTYYLHGGTSRKKREQMINEFQDPETEPSVFVLSLKAGGVGITLTKANHVFHFDRWWNPAVEDQATDRAFRIGQKKNVFVHKFVAIGTLEERIDDMIEDKKKLAGSIVGADESWLTELDNDAFRQLIALNKSAVME